MDINIADMLSKNWANPPENNAPTPSEKSETAKKQRKEECHDARNITRDVHEVTLAVHTLRKLEGVLFSTATLAVAALWTGSLFEVDLW